ncbi:hypothetical protein KCU76_g72, partial [Aureobasidium melanogenum]
MNSHPTQLLYSFLYLLLLNHRNPRPFACVTQIVCDPLQAYSQSSSSLSSSIFAAAILSLFSSFGEPAALLVVPETISYEASLEDTDLVSSSWVWGVFCFVGVAALSSSSSESSEPQVRSSSVVCVAPVLRDFPPSDFFLLDDLAQKHPFLRRYRTPLQTRRTRHYQDRNTSALSEDVDGAVTVTASRRKDFMFVPNLSSASSAASSAAWIFCRFMFAVAAVALERNSETSDVASLTMSAGIRFRG